MPKKQERTSTLLTIKNKIIISKATNEPGRIIRTYLDNIYVKFRYDAEVKVNLLKYEKYLIVSDNTKKELDRKRRKYLKTINNPILLTN